MSLPTYKSRQRAFKLLVLSACCLIILYLLTSYLEDDEDGEDGDSSGVSPFSRAQSIYNVSKLLEEVKSHDYPRKLIDLQNFGYIMNLPGCEDKISALIAVHSAPKNFKLRLLLRETWGQRALLKDTPLRLIFLLGAVVNQELQHQLEQENSIFGDLVQGNFMDHYLNMTYKHTMAFKWFIYNCGQAQILIKVDDDSFVNTPLLLKYLEKSVEPVTSETSQIVAAMSRNSSNNIFKSFSQLFCHPQNLLLCKQLQQGRVKRSYRSKWHMSKREYANRYFPPYCFGYSIIYSSDVLLRLYKAAQSTKYFWIDDIHVTGVLAPQMNITATSANPFVLSLKAFKRVLKGTNNLADKEFLFAWPDMKGPEILCLWQMYLTQEENNITRSSHQSVSQRCDYSIPTKKIFNFCVRIVMYILVFIFIKFYFL